MAPDPQPGEPLTPEQRLQRAYQMVFALCKPRGSEGSREWIMSIPVNRERDPDCVICDGLDAGNKALAELDATRAALQRCEQQRDAGERDVVTAMEMRDAARAEVAKLRDALHKCRDLFTDLRGDWSDNRPACREGWRVIEAALNPGAGGNDAQ